MEELILEHGNMPLDELQHWGIKGMKWGQRRFQNKDGSLTPEGKKRRSDNKDTNNDFKVKSNIRPVVDASSTREGKILSKLTGKKTIPVEDKDDFVWDVEGTDEKHYDEILSSKNPNDVKRISKELSDYWNNVIKTVDKKIHDPDNAARMKEYPKTYMKDLESYTKAVLDEINYWRDQRGENDRLYKIQEINDKYNKKIYEVHRKGTSDIDVELIELERMEELDELEHSNELQHWGIKGMKWGRRRYQNKDGSLTPEGEKRYNKEVEKVEKQKAKLAEKQRIQQNKQETIAKYQKLKDEKAELKAQKKALKDDGKPKKDTGETDEQKRERLLKSVDAKELYENKHLLSYQELNERINRIDTEAKLKSRIVEEKSKTGMEFMDDAANAIGKATNLYRKVDDAYKTVTTSAIGGMVAKKLGIEPPKKEFNINELWKKRNKLSDKEIQDISQRLSNEKKIQDELNRRAKQAQKEADDKRKEKFDKDMAEYKDFIKKEKESRENPKTAKTNTSEPYSMKGKDVVDNVWRRPDKQLLLTDTIQSTELSTYKQVGEKYVQELYGKNEEFITYIDPKDR